VSRVAVLLAVLALLAGCAGATGEESVVPADTTVSRGLDRLLVDGGPTGWASEIQSPHRHVDRDVGAAGIAAGLLAVADGSSDPAVRERALDGARRAGDFLLDAQRGAGRFPDYVDPDGVAGYAYSSYDDGAAGIADLLWTLGERTDDRRYTDASIDAVAWLLSRAEDVPGQPACPRVCRWAWSDDGEPSYRTGMGEGQAGIVYALSLFAERTGDRRIAAHAAGGGAYLLGEQDPDGGMPERADQPARNTGFLSGAAGAAFTFLRLERATGEQRWRDGASRALAFLDRTAVPAAGGSAWPIWVDPAGVPGNPRRATGMEEGAAGIGWVSLQAAQILGGPEHRARAEAAGRWLLAVGRDRDGGTAWPEFDGSPIAHLSTNSGAAGTGWYLDTLGRVTGEQPFRDAGLAARRFLVAAQLEDGTWPSNVTDGRPRLVGEPSWHWGSAGILAYLARLQGGRVDSPGMQPPLVPLG
jgi:hypothetical protein